MSISINGSTGISGVDGSAATPALQGGDTNTGISFGTDEVRINTGGTQRAVVDANGQLGVGTSSVTGKLHVKGDDGINIERSDGANQWSLIPSNGATGSTNLRLYERIGAKEIINITTGGNVGIGTTTPSARLEVSTAAGTEARITSTVDNNADLTFYTNGVMRGIVEGNSLGLALGTTGSLPTTFVTNNTERARIDSSGRLLVATSTSQGSYNLQCYGTGVWGQGAYVNGSDASLKENVQDLESALDVVKALRPVTFQYKSEYSQDTSTQSGFIAQELQQAMQGKQYLDGIVKPGTNHLNVAYQGIIAVLVKAVQELEAEVQALKGGN